jgi:hypothetical protein
MDIRHLLRKPLRFFYEHTILIAVMLLGLFIWVTVFQLAVDDYMAERLWRIRGVWLGNGEFDLFGYTVVYQMEGYTDYSFYYVHWGHNMLNGLMPYSEDFGHIILDGYGNDNGLYMFPPLYAYLYALGIALNGTEIGGMVVSNWGIGILITAFGYLTALPVYGIGKELSNNRHVGEAAALTYLLNPNVLYHTTFAWLNPAPFVFFFFAGFYFLVKGRKHTGTIFIVTAALFKQTAWFLGIPLVVFLLIKARKKETDPPPPYTLAGTEPPKKKSALEFINEYIDFKGFLGSTCLVVAYAGVIMFPFILAQPNVLRYLALAAGGFKLDSFIEVPSYGSPMRFQILPVVAGLPELAQVLDFLVYYGFLLSFGVVLLMGLMAMVPHEEHRPRFYLRRILFLTLIIMLWVHLMGPRGVYKYYFVVFAPFFSIFSSSSMVTSEEESVPFSSSMLWVPIALSLTILVPPRSVYLFAVLLILLGYLIASQIGAFWFIATSPVRWTRSLLAQRLRVPLAWARFQRGRWETYLYETDEKLEIAQVVTT